jgi:hypothetical protein
VAGSAGRDPHLERLHGCDEAIAVIATDVEGLLDELRELRGRAEALEERCAEQEDLLRAREKDVARLEGARERSERRAEVLGVQLAEATREVADLEARADSSAGECARLRESLDERGRRLVVVERELAATRESMRRLSQPAADGRPSAHGDAAETHPLPRVAAHVRFVSLPSGYRLTSSDERCAEPGDRIVVDGHEFLVTRVGRSPLPDDTRPCAFLEPDIRM